MYNAYAAQGFSGSILLASHGKPLISKSYGYAKAEWQMPNSPPTKFRIASLTKQFTAMLVMQLRQRGQRGDAISNRAADETDAAVAQAGPYR